MNHRILSAAWLLIAALAPASVSAGPLELSDVTITSVASYTTQGQPTRKASDTKTAPVGTLTRAEVLVLADGIPVPNVPTSETQAFASSAADFNGVFAVGVNGFFSESALPPNLSAASGEISQFVRNTSASTLGLTLDFTIPAPTVRLFEVGPESPPLGVGERQHVDAAVGIKLLSTVFHPDGTSDAALNLDYGFQVFRDFASGQLVEKPFRDSAGLLSRRVEPDGSVRFQLPELVETGFRLPDLGPGDRLALLYLYFAEASTGFAETGVFAAIGDPFNLSTGGGRIELQAADALPPTTVPEPVTLTTLGFGLVVLGISTRRRRRSHYNRS